MSQADADPSRTPQVESDFSLRKMKIAGAVLLGQMFGSSLLPAMALTLVFVPVTTEFKWTPTQFGYATTALMWSGGSWVRCSATWSIALECG